MLLVGLAFSSGFVVAALQPAQTEVKVDDRLSTSQASGSALDVFWEAWDLVVTDFFGPLPENRERVYGAVRGLLETLNDPYTVLVEPIPRQFEQDDLRGSYGGVGMTLERNADGQVILTPFRESPAAEAGILEGDVLVAVDGVSITPEMDISQDIIARIRGEVGTDVALTIQRDDEQVIVLITRQVIETPSVVWRILGEAKTLGYIQISSFTDRTPGELQNVVVELMEDGVLGLILDLRNNGGGLLQSSIDVIDEFLSEGVVLYETRRGEPERTYTANQGGRALDVPLTVLVNGGTASASEIVAGAIQDHERGMLIGEPTFGKGSVQLIFDLGDGSSLHVTAARWYTPNRHLLDGVGLTPDLVIADDPESEEDEQLNSAIEILESNQ
jgi:carboxyl-terminal processing protease